MDNPKFKIGDVVILKSDEFYTDDLKVYMTVYRVIGDEISCSHFGSVKNRLNECCYEAHQADTLMKIK